MPKTSLSAARQPLLTVGQLERIEEGMLRVLSGVGIRVPGTDLRNALAAKGFRTQGDRVLVEPAVASAFLEETRARSGHAFGPGEAEPPSSSINMDVSQYSEYCIDVETGEMRPFTLESLIEATKTVDCLVARGVRARAPGTPMDLPPELQPVAIYWASLTYGRDGAKAPDPRSVPSHRFILDMAECVGHRITLLPVYVASPLTLAGGSLDAVFEYRDRISETWVLGMPAAGATAPIGLGRAYAMHAAEVVGSAVLLREVLDLDIGWEMQMFPFDLRHMSMVFGSPENVLMQMASAEVDAWLHGTPWKPGFGNMHTMAKEPGSQAAAEKASVMTAGAMLGTRHFVCAGTLSLDEVFSAEQLVIDCEIADHVGNLVAGVNADTDLEGIEDEVRAGIERGFMGLDSTAERYRSACWYPKLFERRLRGPWNEAGSQSLRDMARDELRKLDGRHEYALDGAVQKNLDRLFEQAKSELG